jgi:hypothetical protein
VLSSVYLNICKFASSSPGRILFLLKFLNEHDISDSWIVSTVSVVSTDPEKVCT